MEKYIFFVPLTYIIWSVAMTTVTKLSIAFAIYGTLFGFLIGHHIGYHKGTSITNVEVVSLHGELTSLKMDHIIALNNLVYCQENKS